MDKNNDDKVYSRDTLVFALESVGAEVLSTGVKCPFHEDHHASGSIFKDEKGHWRFKCHGPFEGLLSALVVGMRRLDSVHVPLERMADFCRWGAAVAPAVGWSEEEFIYTYKKNQLQSMADNYENDPVYTAIEGILEKKQILHGTATEILKEIIHFFGKSIPKDLPRTARGLVSHLTRIRPNLRKHGIVHIPPKGLSHHDRRHPLKRARKIKSPMRDGA